ncbi:MAG: tetratricopeptide repeat protein [Oscillospiraceae bacterium]|nr:tetratricopeptide repeat protein [Oscillospiraceae bacterium]
MKKLLSIILAILLTVTLFTSCAETSEALVSMYLNMGEKYLLDLNYEEAIVYFNKVIEVEPRNSRAYMGAAEAYVGLGDTESAIELLKTALDVFSDDEDVTIELLEMLIEIDPTTSEWYITLADIYEGRGDTDSAVAVLSDAVDSVTDGDSKITILQRLIGLDAANVDWYLELAQVYVDSSNRTSAISILRQGMDRVGDDKTELYDKLIEIDSGTTQWYFELAGVYEDKNNISSAVDTLELGLNNFEDDATKIDFSEELIEIDETNAEWYLTIAYIYIDQTNTNDAIAILKEGLEKASDTTEIEELLNQLAPDTSGLVTTSRRIYDKDSNLYSSYEYNYDSGGESLTYTGNSITSDGTPFTYTSIYEYDSQGNIVERTYKSTTTDGTTFTSTTTFTYEYDSNGNKVSSTQIDSYTDSGSTSTTTCKYEYEYDSDGNLTVQTQKNSDGHWLYKTEYEYDSHGNISKETHTNTFSYDDYSDTNSYWIRYDYEYDNDGNIVKSVESYSDPYDVMLIDSEGNYYTFKSQTTENEYDEETRIVKTTKTFRYTNGTVTIASYEFQYDTSGNLVSRTATVDGVTTKYIIEREYQYGSDGKVQKCVVTTYYADTGNIYSTETMERIN